MIESINDLGLGIWLDLSVYSDKTDEELIKIVGNIRRKYNNTMGVLAGEMSVRSMMFVVQQLHYLEQELIGELESRRLRRLREEAKSRDIDLVKRG